MSENETKSTGPGVIRIALGVALGLFIVLAGLAIYDHGNNDELRCELQRIEAEASGEFFAGC